MAITHTSQVMTAGTDNTEQIIQAGVLDKENNGIHMVVLIKDITIQVALGVDGSCKLGKYLKIQFLWGRYLTLIIYPLIVGEFNYEHCN